ncbi:MAG: hypothetical protein M3401_05290 [Actinomycetota bacterium]|nr:hypothetical protein [Actinomycetota bacterium]
MAATPQETLADEHRRRTPAAVAAISAGILSLVGSVLAIAARTDFPSVHLVRALDERLGGNPRQPGLKAREVLYINDRLAEQVGAALVATLIALAIGFALTYLYRATYARRPEVGRATIVVIIAGALLVAVPGLVSSIALAIEAKSFADSSQQTAEAARDVIRSPVVISGAFLRDFGGLILAFGIVLISLKAMSVGLLTRFMGVLGIIVGIISIIRPIGESLPFVQMLWLIALGMLFLHKWGGRHGLPPAWSTGEAHPWPTQQELREARQERAEEKAAARGDREEKPRTSSNGKARGHTGVPETPAPEVPKRAPHPSSKKKKRRRR